jgi:alpha-ketoglutarate-dependent 2,4-dichlorophenoxyacetate dioxygenase
MDTASITTTALHPLFGVEVHGVDLCGVRHDRGFADIRRLFDEHSLLLFRDQSLDDEAHLRFGSMWGAIEDRSMGMAVGGGPARMDNVSNRLDDGTIAGADNLHTIDLMGNQLWHTDSTFLPVPALANILAARVLSSSGGETEFTSTRVALSEMPERLREVAHRAVFRHRLAHSRRDLSPELVERHLARWPDQTWRAVWRNPTNGLDALYIASHAMCIEGMDLDEGQRLIAEMLEFCTARERVYSHSWRPGDVLVWDERATLHRGRPWPYHEERTLASICISASAADGLDSVSP